MSDYLLPQKAFPQKMYISHLTSLILEPHVKNKETTYFSRDSRKLNCWRRKLGRGSNPFFSTRIKTNYSQKTTGCEISPISMCGAILQTNKNDVKIRRISYE